MAQQDDLIRRGEVIESVRRIIQSRLPEQAIYDGILEISTAFDKENVLQEIDAFETAERSLMKEYEEEKNVYHYHDGKSDGLIIARNIIEKGGI